MNNHLQSVSYSRLLPLIFIVVLLFRSDPNEFSSVAALSSSNPSTRRQILYETSNKASSLITSSFLLPTVIYPSKSIAADALQSSSPATATTTQSPNGLASRLAQRDVTVLKNRIFNIPPSVQVYPGWMKGEWDVTSSFAGYVFPSKKIPRERIIQNFGIAGFQKCSIAATADVGKQNVKYRYRIDEVTGQEDRKYNFPNAINAYLGYPAVQSNGVIYDPLKNTNRMSIDFVQYKTINAERIELFCNARESEEYQQQQQGDSVDSATITKNIFVCSEYIRQVTFGTGNIPGIPRQAITNYANYYTWIIWQHDNNINDTQQQQRPLSLRGNLLTAAYLDPQDPAYFDEPQQPVAVYSHSMTAQRI